MGVLGWEPDYDMICYGYGYEYGFGSWAVSCFLRDGYCFFFGMAVEELKCFGRGYFVDED